MTKSSLPEQLRPAEVHTCPRCGIKFTRVVGLICPDCREASVIRREGGYRLGSPLTHREDEIAGLIAQGRCNKEIATELYLTEGTVKQYVVRIFQRYGVSSRLEVALRWIREHQQQAA